MSTVEEVKANADHHVVDNIIANKSSIKIILKINDSTSHETSELHKLLKKADKDNLLEWMRKGTITEVLMGFAGIIGSGVTMPLGYYWAGFR